MPPLFSIALPVFNAEKTLARAITSVLAQTFTDWELIVVDDGSTDRSLSIAHELAGAVQGIRVIRQEHGGCGSARRRGAREAQGTYVVKLDADDELESDALEKMYRFIQRNPGYDIYSATAIKVYADGTQEPFFIDPRFDEECSLALSDLLDECYIFGGCSAIRRDVLERIGGFRAEVYCEDYDVWLRALATGATHRYTPQVLYRYYFDTPGHMNEDPTRSLTSFIGIFTDLIESGLLSREDEKHAVISVQKFSRLLEQYQAAGVTEAVFTEQQARRFRKGVESIFGRRVGAVIMRVAKRGKWIVKPLRVAGARRSFKREAKNDSQGK